MIRVSGIISPTNRNSSRYIRVHDLLQVRKRALLLLGRLVKRSTNVRSELARNIRVSANVTGLTRRACVFDLSYMIVAPFFSQIVSPSHSLPSCSPHKDVLDLTVGSSQCKLPGSLEETEVLKATALGALEEWNETFGEQNPELRVAYRHLKDVVGASFPNRQVRCIYIYIHAITHAHTHTQYIYTCIDIPKSK